MTGKTNSLLSGGRTIIVLGMHRSGTSCLAGALESAGVFLGKVSRRNPYNPKGNLENKKIIALHDALLRTNNGSWDNPPPVVAWSEPLKTERDRIVRSFQGKPIWGFKDPRVLLVLNGWLESLSRPCLSFAGTFRHPGAVVQSLFRRNGIPYNKGFSLWKIYNEKFLLYHQLFHFPVISFDLPESDYRDKIRKLLDRLALDKDLQTDGYFDGNLRHHDRGPDIGGQPDIQDVYEKLKGIAI